MADVVITGAEDLEVLARRLKAESRGDLRKELLKGIRLSSKSTVKDIRRSAQENLPRRGGLAALVAKSSFGARTRTTGNTVGVTIQGNSRAVKNLKAMNAGRLRHPVWGNREVWVEQSIASGWFSKPIERDVDHIRSSIQHAMSEVASKLERKV